VRPTHEASQRARLKRGHLHQPERATRIMNKLANLNRTMATEQIRTGKYAGLYRHDVTLTGTDALLSLLEDAENVLYGIVDDDEAIPEDIQADATGVLESIQEVREGKPITLSIIDNIPRRLSCIK
jgi:hypothetical protein